MIINEQLRSVLIKCIDQVESNEINTMEQLVEQLTTELTCLTKTTINS